MSADERETRQVVSGDGFFGAPGLLVVAIAAKGSEHSAVGIDMTSGTTAGGKLFHGPTIVVTQKTRDVLVRIDKRDARSCLVIKRKIIANRLPVFSSVAERAISRERVVGNNRSSGSAPSGLRNQPAATARDADDQEHGDAQARQAGPLAGEVFEKAEHCVYSKAVFDERPDAICVFRVAEVVVGVDTVVPVTVLPPDAGTQVVSVQRPAVGLSVG